MIQASQLQNAEQTNYQQTALLTLAFCWFLLPTALVTRLAHTFVEVLIILTPVLAFALWGKKWTAGYRWNKKILAALALFAVLTVVPQFIPFHPASALDSVRSFHIKFLLIGLGVLFVFTSPTLTKAFLWGCVLAVGIATFYGMYEWLLDIEHLPGGSSGHLIHVAPFGYHPNEFGAYFTYFLPAILAGGFIFRRLSRKKLPLWFLPYALVCFFALWVLVLTGSRASLGGLILAILIFVVGYALKRRNWTLSLTLTGIFLAASVTILALTQFSEPAADAIKRWQPGTYSMETFAGRTDRVWPAHWRQIQPNLWFGLNFSRDMIDDYMEEVPFTHEHSMYLRFIVDSGLVGLAGFIILFVALLIAGFKRLFELDYGIHYLLLLGVFSSFIGALLVRSAVAKYYHYQLEYFSAMLLALSYIKSLNFGKEKHSDKSQI